MKRLVVDTSVFIDFLRRKDKESSLYIKLIESYDLVVSIITITELYSGKSVQTVKGRKVLEDILSGVEIRIPDVEMAIKAGELRAKYQLSLADSFIACLAMDLGLPLSTFDLSDFGKIKEIEVLRPEMD